METQLLSNYEIDKAVKFLKDGLLVSFPTETVYGLGADATNTEAVKKVFQAKNRPTDNPLIVTVSSIEMVEDFAIVNELARKLMTYFWPGPLTIILPIKQGTLDMIVTGGLKTVAFRNPDNETTLKLIASFGKPIVGPSANLSGTPSPTTASHVYQDMNGRISAIIDDGSTKIGVESTIIDMSNDYPVILRPGAIDENMLKSVIPKVGIDQHNVADNETPKAPGMKYKHYSPKAKVIIIDSTHQFLSAIEYSTYNENSISVLATEQVLANLPMDITKYSLGRDITSATHKLFSGLRELDSINGIKVIFAQAFSNDGLGKAYMNRLDKAADGNHYK